MAKIFHGNTCFDAWSAAATEILLNGSQENLIIECLTPSDFTNLQLWKVHRNPIVTCGVGDNLRHVINTIFPFGLASFYTNRNDFYNKYKAVYGKSTNRGWGTYFQRLIQFDKHLHNNGVNQLEKAITALNGNSPQKNYINFHLTDVSLDSNVRPMGAPCWHFGQITITSTDSLNLIAVYRSHDYFNKALGNYIGLAKLLEYICTATQRTAGKLVIHSIHAYNGGTQNNFAQLLA